VRSVVVLGLLVTGAGAAGAGASPIARSHLHGLGWRTAAHGLRSGPITVIVARVRLRPPHRRGRARGVAEVLKTGATYRVKIVAHGLKRNTVSNAYAVWLYNTPDECRLLGFVYPEVGRNGRVRTAGALPKDAKRFHRLVISLEISARPRDPHHVVLSGRLSI
jgi:hypothetical protein